MEALAVFTNRGRDRLLSEGGSQAWSLKPERAEKMRYIVCTQNREDGDWGEPTHAQGEGFLIAKIASVDPSPEGRDGRYIIRFSEYADISVPNMAYQWRNPVRYIDLDQWGIDPSKLTFKPVNQPGGEPPRTAPSSPPHFQSGGVPALDMAAAKKALAAFYNVPVSSIEITIRG